MKAYQFPWNKMFMALSPGWIAILLVRNSILVLVIYGMLELRFYAKRARRTHFKFNGKFPSEHPSDVFMFKSQNIDNIIRTFATGVPIWTAHEVFGMWCFAHSWGPWPVMSVSTKSKWARMSPSIPAPMPITCTTSFSR
jgi:sterol desaturase/sphingolipid hydroxylase (fatty acid hydroxylase superfamily)